MLLSSSLTGLVLSAIAAIPLVSAGTLASPPLLRRQSPHPEHDNQPDIQWWAHVVFKNNCPAGTTLAVYSPFEYKFTLNSVHSNARQSKTTMSLYAEDYNDITVFAMINEGNNPGAQDPTEKRYVYTSLFMDNYWLVKYPGSTVKDIPVSITPEKPPANGKCAKLVCNAQSCKANTQHPDGRKRAIESEVGDEGAAALDWEGYVNHCPDTWEYTVTYCPDGKL